MFHGSASQKLVDQICAEFKEFAALRATINGQMVIVTAKRFEPVVIGDEVIHLFAEILNPSLREHRVPKVSVDVQAMLDQVEWRESASVTR